MSRSQTLRPYPKPVKPRQRDPTPEEIEREAALIRAERIDRGEMLRGDGGLGFPRRGRVHDPDIKQMLFAYDRKEEIYATFRYEDPWR